MSYSWYFKAGSISYVFKKTCWSISSCSLFKWYPSSFSTPNFFGMYLDEKLNLANKGIDVIKKLNNVVPRRALIIIYKSFPRPDLDYDDVIYDQPS